MELTNSKRWAEKLVSMANTDTNSQNERLVQFYLEKLSKNELAFNIQASTASAILGILEDSGFSYCDTSYISGDTVIKNKGYNQEFSETSNSAINGANERDHSYFERQSYKFLYTLRHTVFEDGFDNEATALFDSMLERNKYVAIAWLQEFWCEHQSEPIVFAAIIRLIGRIGDKGYWKMLFSIVRTGFNDCNVEVQEAAIMVAENWRNQNCLSSLLNTTFSTSWLKQYADQVIAELKEELEDEVH